MLTLRCYICGKELAGVFTLASMATPTDRVFTVHTDCARIVSDTLFIEVQPKEVDRGKEGAANNDKRHRRNR